MRRGSSSVARTMLDAGPEMACAVLNTGHGRRCKYAGPPPPRSQSRPDGVDLKRDLVVNESRTRNSREVRVWGCAPYVRQWRRSMRRRQNRAGGFALEARREELTRRRQRASGAAAAGGGVASLTFLNASSDARSVPSAFPIAIWFDLNCACA
jgi:hypothetical protein